MELSLPKVFDGNVVIIEEMYLRHVLEYYIHIADGDGLLGVIKAIDWR